MMLPRLTPSHNLHQTTANFLDTLKTTPFSREIRADFASHLISSTDNSIYQILPQAVVFPKTTEENHRRKPQKKTTEENHRRCTRNFYIRQ